LTISKLSIIFINLVSFFTVRKEGNIYGTETSNKRGAAKTASCQE
jgi:hypothetical protein